MIPKTDGTPDWKAMTEEAKARPALSYPEQKAALLKLVAETRARAEALGLEGVTREADVRASTWRKSEEDAGRVRQAAESKRLADAITARKAEANSNPTPLHDAQVEAKKRYDESMRLLAEKVAAPCTAKDLQDAADIAGLRSQQRQRYAEAKAESLLRGRGLPAEKF
jgi:hypothetical protein